MVAPDVAGKTQHLAHAQGLSDRIEGFGHDVTGDAVLRQRRRHVGRRHDDQVDFVCADRPVFPRHGRQAVLAQQILQHDVVDGIPERDGNRLAAQFLDVVDSRRHRQARSAHVVPGHDLGRDLAAEARPDRHRRQQVHPIHLARDEGLDHLRPAAQQRGLFRLDAGLVEQAVVMRHQQRRGVGDGQVANAHWRVRLALCTGVERRQQ
ncbi:hypothetical protein G6F40_015133 [Rhizopus arrhizus]|nr:hypothetical protein G6F40_015133 [Rhizopus arrhizus]